MKRENFAVKSIFTAGVWGKRDENNSMKIKKKKKRRKDWKRWSERGRFQLVSRKECRDNTNMGLTW